MPNCEDGSERYLAEYRGETVYDRGAGASPLPLEGDNMGALKRWKNIGGGQGGGFYKFTTEGQALEGIWRGTRQGKYGDNGQVELPDGSIVQFTLNVTLRDLVKVPDGTEVRITYRGMARAKNGNEFKAFSIQVEEGADIADDDDSVPF